MPPPVRGLDLGICKNKQIEPTLFKRGKTEDHTTGYNVCCVVFCILLLRLIRVSFEIFSLFHDFLEHLFIPFGRVTIVV